MMLACKSPVCCFVLGWTMVQALPVLLGAPSETAARETAPFIVYQVRECRDQTKKNKERIVRRKKYNCIWF